MMLDFDLTGLLSYFAYLALVPLVVVACILYFRYRDWRQRKAEETWRGPGGLGEQTRDAEPSEESSHDEIDSQTDHRQVIRPSVDPFDYVLGSLLIASLLDLIPRILLPVLLVFYFVTAKLRWRQRERRLERDGESTSATIVDLDIEGEDSGRQRVPDLLPFWARNSRYQQKKVWLTYRFRVPDRPAVEYEGRFEAGDSRHLAMVIGKTVQVRYLPADPRVSRLEL